jgi:hypothetical protein
MASSRTRRDLVEAGEVVFIILHIAERDIRGERSVFKMNAAELCGGHFPMPETRALH